MSRVKDGNRHKTVTMPQESATDLESRLAQALRELSETRERYRPRKPTRSGAARAI